MGFIKDSLLAYVQQNSDPISKSLATESPTLDRVRLMPNVKGSATINLLSTDGSLKNGAGCGFDPDGDVTLSQRTVATVMLKKEFSFCDDDLIGSFAEHAIRNDGSIPYEEVIFRDIIRGVADSRELLMWQGDTDSEDADLAYLDGYLKIAREEAAVIDVAIAANTSVYDAIKSVKQAIPAKLKRKDVKINVSPEMYEKFIDKLVALNYYHYTGPHDDFPTEYTFPGSRVKVVETPGLEGTLNILASTDDNLVYATNVPEDGNNLIVDYNKMKETTDVKVKFNMGVQIALPAYVVLGTFAAAPTE